MPASDPNLNIVQQILFEFNEGSASDAMAKAGAFAVKEQDKIQKRINRLTEGNAKESTRRTQRIQLEAQQKLAKEQIRLVSKTFDFIADAELKAIDRKNERAAIRQKNEWKRKLQTDKANQAEELTQVKGHQTRLTNAALEGGRRRTAAEKEEQKRRTQNEAAALKERVSATVAAEQRITNEQKEAGRRRTIVNNEIQKRQTTVFNENAKKRVAANAEELKEIGRQRQTAASRQRARDAEAERRRTSEQKQAERERQSALNASLKVRDRILVAAQREEQARRDQARKEDLLKEKAHHDRYTATWRSFLSNLRTLNETGFRAIVHAGQSHFARMHADRAAAQRQELSETRRFQSIRIGIFRSGYREQEAIVSRSLVRQQGAMTAFSQQTSRGVIGSFLSIRNVLLGAGVFLSARSIFGPVADYQQTQIAFESLLGSAERAESFLQRVRQFAEVTPFETAQVLESAQSLLGVGFAARDIIPDLTAIGNVAATLGQGEEQISGVVRALGQIRGKGKTSAEELNQISEQLPGFSAVQAIAEHLGITVAETFDRMQQGEVSAEEGIEGILEGMRKFKGAAGAMDKQSRTINGRLSTLHDVFQNLVIDALEPFTDEVANAIGKMTEFLTLLFRGNGIWATLRSAILGVATAVGILLSFQLVRYLQILLLSINPVVLAFLGLGAAFGILIRQEGPVRDLFNMLIDKAQWVYHWVVIRLRRGFRGLIPVGHWRGVVRSFGVLAKAIVDNVGTIQDAFGALVGGHFSEAGDLFGQVFGALRDAVTPAATFVGEQLVEIWNRGFAIATDWIQAGGVDKIIQGVFNAFDAVFAWLRGALERWWKPLLAGFAVAVVASFVGWPALIIAGIAAALVAVSPTLRDRITDFASNIFTPVLDWITGDLPGLIMAGITALGRFLGGPVVRNVLSRGVITAVLATAAVVAGAAALFVHGFLDGLKHSLPDVVKGIRDLFGDAIHAALGGLEGIPGLGAVFSGLEGALRGPLALLTTFMELVERIPTPLIEAVGAFVLLRKAWLALSSAQIVLSMLSNLSIALSFVRNFVTQLAESMTLAGQNMEATSASFMVASTSMTVAGKTMQFLGAGLSFLANNFLAVTAAVTIGVGIWQQHRASQEAARRASEQFWQSIHSSLEDGKDFNDVVSDMIDKNTELAHSLTDAGVSADQFTELLLGNAEAARTFASLPSSVRTDMAAFAEELDKAARTELELKRANHELTPSQIRMLNALDDGRHIGQSYATVLDSVESGQAQIAATATDAADQTTEYIDAAERAADATDRFRDAIDRLTGNAIDIGRARLALAQTSADVAAAMREEGFDPSQLSDDWLTMAEQIIDVRDALDEAGQDGSAAFDFLRESMIRQVQATGQSRAAAESFVEGLLPTSTEIAQNMRQHVLHPIRQAIREAGGFVHQLLNPRLSDEDRENLEGQLTDAQERIQTFFENHPGLEIQWRIHIEEVRWDQTVSQWERLFEDGQVDIGVRVHTAPVGGAGGNRPNAGFTSGPGGGIGGIVPVPPPTGIPGSEQSWTDWGMAVSNVFKELSKAIDRVGDEIVSRFGRTMSDLLNVGRKGARLVVDAITGILTDGSLKIQLIVHDYAVRLADNLNPLLSAIGQPKVSAFAEGDYMPRIAESSQGPQVHVFNEAGHYGEAYIPFDPRHRGKARDIAEKSARRLGGNVQWFQEGGITAPVQNVTGDWVGLHPEFARRLSIWATALGDVFNVTSGFRTYSEQVDAYNRYLRGEGAKAAVPGTSMHEFGLAADGPHWRDRGPGGYRLVYPMSFEPWHVEPVEGRGLGDAMIVDPLPQPPGTGNRGWLSTVAEGFMKYVYQKALTWAGGVGFGAPQMGSFSVAGDVMAGIRRAMSIVGVPASWLQPLLTLIERESGFNPHAYNPNGGASGLMQTKPGTFAANALPGFGNIFAIVDNVIAGLRYIIGRYGSIFNVGQAVADHPTSGYANGGVITDRQLAWLGESGPEVVLPLTRPGRLQTLMNETGITPLLLKALMAPNQPDVESHLQSVGRGSTSRSVSIDLNLSLDGDIDPRLYSELSSAVRSGVADGMARSEAIEGRW